MKAAVRVAGRLARPVSLASRRLRPASSWLTLIGWHRIGDAGDGLTTTLDGFRRHLDVLDDWGARVLPLDEAVARLRAGTLPPRAVVLTFDDGYASVVEQAWPILRGRRWPATMFMVSGYLDPGLRLPWDEGCPDAELVRLMSRGQLEEAAVSGLDIGSHTVNHPWLPTRDAGELRRELTDSRAQLEDLLHRRIDSVAYPAGGWTSTVRDAADRAGYTTGITVDRGINTADVDGLTLRRAFAPEAPEDLRLILDGAYSWLRPLDDWRGRNGRGQLS